MDIQARKKISHVLSLVLRHKPWLLELEIDDQGWTDANAVLEGLQGMRNVWRNLTLADLEEVVATADKARYEMSGNRIRALYGHSIPQKIGKVLAVPPEILYHGTTREALPVIQENGLRPMSRQYVHCAIRPDMAIEVGNRKRGQTIILEVRASLAYQQGIPFYQGNELVWLADHIPPQYLAVMGSS
jgi:putative RNA 2'-phosphotransferase